MAPGCVGSFRSCPVLVAHQLSALVAGSGGKRNDPRHRLLADHSDAARPPVSLFDLEARFFVPTHGWSWASCRDAVKAGRRAVRAADATACRPRLDGVEHGATLGWVGAAIWRPS